MKNIFIFLLLILFSCKQNVHSNVQSGVYDQAPKVTLTFSDLQNILKKNPKIKKIDDFLTHLPEAYRRRFTLIHTSESLQQASYDNPRVIMYDDDATLLIAFNGSPEQKGFDELEVIEFNQHESRFHFYSISFPENDSSKKITVSGKDPARCQECHTKHLRPNWDQYPNWPNAYLGDDDLHPNYQYYSEKEVDGFKNFLISAKHKQRYRHLVDLETGYAPEKEPSIKRRGISRSAFKHNLELTIPLLNNSLKQAAAIIKNTPNYETLKFIYLGVLSCKIDDLIPKSETIIRETLDGYETSILDFDSLLALEGVDVLSLAPQAPSRSKYKRGFDQGDPRFTFLDALGSVDPELKKLLLPFERSHTYYSGKEVKFFSPVGIEFCKSVGAASLEAFRKRPFVRATGGSGGDVVVDNPTLSFLNQPEFHCLLCHSGKTPAGRLDLSKFESVQKNRDEILNQVLQGKMPLVSSLDAQQRKEFQTNLEKSLAPIKH